MLRESHYPRSRLPDGAEAAPATGETEIEAQAAQVEQCETAPEAVMSAEAAIEVETRSEYVFLIGPARKTQQ